MQFTRRFLGRKAKQAAQSSKVNTGTIQKVHIVECPSGHIIQKHKRMSEFPEIDTMMKEASIRARPALKNVISLSGHYPSEMLVFQMEIMLEDMFKEGMNYAEEQIKLTLQRLKEKSQCPNITSQAQ